MVQVSGTAAAWQGRRVDLKCDRPLRMGRSSARTARVALQFGVPAHADKTLTVLESCRVTLGPGRLVLLVGPSGSGKSTALQEIDRQFSGSCSVDRIRLPHDAALVDSVAPWAPLGETLALLAGCGLGAAPLWLRPCDALSEGERFRARLARAIALHSRSGLAAPLLCDEFCSLLHRRVARAISFSLHKAVVRRGLSVVVACSHDDVVADLQPHTLVRLLGDGRCEVTERDTSPRRPFSLRRRMRIEPGKKKDYEAFATMHYRATDELGFVDKVFVMRDGDELVGIVVYSYAALELSMRNRATDGLFSRNASRVNRSLRILRRLVIHPDLRGCGLGQHLVRKTLPLVGTEYVECLAAMGEINPIFEKAGMRRIGQYERSRSQQDALEQLRAMDVDPSGHAFVMQVCRRRRVREIVAGLVYAWYAATTVNGKARVQRQSPEFLAQTFRGIIGLRPVYYLWKRP